MNKMTKTDVAKAVVSIVVGSGTYMIVSAIVKNNIVPETVFQRLKVNAGTFVLASMVADASSKYTDNAIDKIVEVYNEVRGKIQEDQNS